MSRFIERLKQLSDGIPQPIGFRKAEADLKRPKIQLLVAISGKASSGLTASLDAANAGLMRPKEGTEVTDIIKNLSDTVAIPWGVRITGEEEETENGVLMKASVDFIVFPSTAPLTGLLSKDTGRIIEIDVTTGDTILRTLNTTTVDAVLISQGKSSSTRLTWEELIGFQRIAGMISKPVIAPVPAGISREELQTLWEGGIDGVIVEVSGSGGGEALKRLRENIDQLEYPKTKQNEKRLAIAPRIQFSSRQETEEEEEEEE
jgi:hypothetical protein